MKLIQVTASYKPAYSYGGPVVSISSLAEELVRSGIALEVLATSANGPGELPVRPGVSCHVSGVKATYFKRLTKDHSHFSPSLLLAFFRMLTSAAKGTEGVGRAEVLIHIHAWWNCVSVFACLIARLRHCKVVLSPRGTLSAYTFSNHQQFAKKMFNRLAGPYLLNHCHFHVTTEKEKRDVERILSPESITVIPNFVYLPEISDGADAGVKSGDAVKLLFLSRIDPKKGLEILIAALSLLLDAGQLAGLECRLTIAGGGESNYIHSIEAVASQLNCAVHWTGEQNQEEKWRLLREHDLLILPSWDENFGNIVIESLAMGTPVVLSDRVGLAGYVEEKGFGWTCRLTVESVAASIRDAIADEVKRKRIGREAPAQIRQDFNPHLLVADYIRMYSKILKA